MARIQTSVIQIQKQPSRSSIKSFEAKRFLKKKREAEVIMIHDFWEHLWLQILYLHHPKSADCENCINSTSENWAEYFHDYDFASF